MNNWQLELFLFGNFTNVSCTKFCTTSFLSWFWNSTASLFEFINCMILLLLFDWWSGHLIGLIKSLLTCYFLVFDGTYVIKVLVFVHNVVTYTQTQRCFIKILLHIVSLHRAKKQHQLYTRTATTFFSYSINRKLVPQQRLKPGRC